MASLLSTVVVREISSKNNVTCLLASTAAVFCANQKSMRDWVYENDAGVIARRLADTHHQNNALSKIIRCSEVISIRGDERSKQQTAGDDVVFFGVTEKFDQMVDPNGAIKWLTPMAPR